MNHRIGPRAATSSGLMEQRAERTHLDGVASVAQHWEAERTPLLYSATVPQPRPTASVWPREITKSTQSAAVHASELRHRITSNPLPPHWDNRTDGRHHAAPHGHRPAKRRPPVGRSCRLGPWRFRRAAARSPALPPTTSAWMITWSRSASTTRTGRKLNPCPTRVRLTCISGRSERGSNRWVLPHTERKSAFGAWLTIAGAFALVTLRAEPAGLPAARAGPARHRPRRQLMTGLRSAGYVMLVLPAR